MNVERYLTPDVYQAFNNSLAANPSLHRAFQAALPPILTRHRADVLREAAAEAHGRATEATSEDSSWRGVRRWLLRMADEAVAE